ncbi:MAG TPA: M56 family peptidase [Bacteroidetes bacterium]|nr:M56 family peptidase [Bacteroidota bacterium]
MIQPGEYLLESGISLGLFYLLYWLLLRKQTFFGLNRLILLGTALLSLVIPLFHFTLPASPQEGSILYVVEFLAWEVTGKGNEGVSQDAGAAGIGYWLTAGYLCGMFFFLFRFLVQIFHIVILIRSGRKIRTDDSVVILTRENIPAFSFFRWIVINEECWEREDISDILAHEKEHALKFHSLDILFMEIFTMVHWFNPFAWLYKMSLKQVHEYQADREVIRQGANTLHYQNLILQQIFGHQFFRFVNHFNQFHLKKRFIMMTDNRKRKTAAWRSLALIPAAAVLIALFGFNSKPGGIAWNQPPVNETIIQNAAENTPQNEGNIPSDQEEPIFFVVEEMPLFVYKGDTSQEAFRHYITDHLVYPEEAHKKGIEGKVYVSFIVEKDGKMSTVEIVRGTHELLDTEALRVINECPHAWIPGRQRGQAVRVAFTFPMVFTLKENNKE